MEMENLDYFEYFEELLVHGSYDFERLSASLDDAEVSKIHHQDLYLDIDSRLSTPTHDRHTSDSQPVDNKGIDPERNLHLFHAIYTEITEKFKRFIDPKPYLRTNGFNITFQNPEMLGILYEFELELAKTPDPTLEGNDLSLQPQRKAKTTTYLVLFRAQNFKLKWLRREHIGSFMLHEWESMPKMHIGRGAISVDVCAVPHEIQLHQVNMQTMRAKCCYVGSKFDEKVDEWEEKARREVKPMEYMALLSARLVREMEKHVKAREGEEREKQKDGEWFMGEFMVFPG